MTTRYGFEGDDPKPGTPPAAEKPNLAKTVFGHEVHLPSMPKPASTPAATKPEKDTAAANEPRVNQPTMMAGSQYAGHAISQQAKQSQPATEQKSRGQKPTKLVKGQKSSAPPAPIGGNGARQGVARFLGRRNTAGNIVPLTQTEIELPKAAWIRPALTVGLAALGSFLIVAALLWLIGPKAPPVPPPTPAQAAVQLTKPLATSPPPAPPVTSLPKPTIEPPHETAPVERANIKPLRSKAGRIRRAKSADPDAPLPPTFF